jgi:uncharacterized protein (TIRG00374 family)
MNRFIINLLKITLATLLLWLLVHHSLLNFKLLKFIFTKPIQIFYIFILLTIVVLLSARRWFLLNSIQGFIISYKDTLIATYIGLTFNTLFPGSVGGDLVRINYLFKHTPKKKIAGALSVIADRAMGLSGVLFLLCMIGVFCNSIIAVSEFLMLFIAVSLWILLFISLITLFLLLSIDKIRIPSWIKNHFLRQKIQELLFIIRIYKMAPWIIIECIVISIIIQLLLALTLVFISYLLEFNSVSVLDYTIASLITQIASLIPISPGGFGVGEMAFGKTVLQLNPNIPAAYATIYLAFRILNMLFCAPGIVFFLKTKTFADNIAAIPSIEVAKTGESLS